MSRAAVGSLVEVVHDPDQEWRGKAAVALGRLGYLTFIAEAVDNDRISEELRKSIPTWLPPSATRFPTCVATRPEPWQAWARVRCKPSRL